MTDLRGALAVSLLLGLAPGCVSLAERPPLSPLAGREVPPEPAPTPREAPIPSLAAVRIVDHPADRASLRMVEVVMPSAPTTVMFLAFPDRAPAKRRPVVPLALRLAQQQLARTLPGGADGFWFDWGHVVGLQVVALPSQAVPAFARLKAALSPDDALKDYARRRFSFLQTLVTRNAGSWEAIGRTLTRMGRYGADHPWAQGAATQVRALARVKKRAVKRLWRRLFDPRDAVLVVVGPEEGRVDPARVAQAFPASAEAGPRPGLGAPPAVPPLRSESGHRFHAVWTRDEQTLLRALHLGPDLGHPDYPAFWVLSTALDGFASEANEALRHQQGASYGVGTSIIPRPGVSELSFGGWVAPDAALDLLRVHDRIVDRVRREGLSAAELAQAKARVRGMRARTLDEPEKVARRLLSCASFGVPVTREACLELSRLEAVTAQDVARVARTHLHPDKVEWMLIGDLDEAYTRFQFEGTVLRYRFDGPD